jgi:hypothetical protein
MKALLRLIDESKSNNLHMKIVPIAIFCFGLINTPAGLADPYTGGTSSNGSTQTYRDPLIPGALWSAPYEAPAQIALPPVGSGSFPPAVTAGQTGDPTLPPWNNRMPANTLGQQDNQVTGLTNSYSGPPGSLGPLLAPYITPPPSALGADPGSLYTVNNYPTDAAVVPVNAGGGLPTGMAPTTRRGGQTTADFGLTKRNGSIVTDFGQNLIDLPNLAVSPAFSQDGPRTLIGQPTSPSSDNSNLIRNPNLPNAQQTINQYGARILFNGTTQAVETYAQY